MRRQQNCCHCLPSLQAEKRKNWATTASLLSSPSFQKKKKKKKKKNKTKKNKTQRKKTHRKEKKCKEGRELTFSSLVSAFGMKHSSCLFFSTFLKPCVSRLLEALCYSSLGALPSFG
jgi:hypothetical protein